MTDFRDVTGEQRYEQGFTHADGETRRVWADYSVQGDRRAILHVEAEDELRGSGAAGQFMQSLADHARAEGHKLTPVCGYAVAWFRRHKDQADVVG
ncbi:GNAT family N-acetyltransferase [Brevundimonas sp.]|uniref:GNAT family N-acetyltransferase n=1 Tax=Brevundimonas sp. TaxID=1871086 RepID=UPI00286BC6D6|nr:GNAT family N-acetyltransferase [Brevundimonas sp.]